MCRFNNMSDSLSSQRLTSRFSGSPLSSYVIARTCVKVDSHSKKRSCDGHEGFAVVIRVKSNSPDPLMDGIH